MKFYNILGTFNRTSKLTISGIEELIQLLESSDYNNKIHSNGFSKFNFLFKHSN
jgi:hypothetical protein